MGWGYIRIQRIDFTRENGKQSEAKALGPVPGPANAEKVEKMLVLAPLGLVTLILSALAAL